MSSADGMQPLTVSVEVAARLLGISRGLAFDLVRRGVIPALRLGRRWVVPRRALERMLDPPRSGISASGGSRDPDGRQWPA